MNQRNPHGGEVLRLARELGAHPDTLLDFSSNADSLVDHITSRLVAAAPVAHHHYPDDDCTELRERIAAHEHVAPENILAGNGSSELIFLALSALKLSRAHTPLRVVIVSPVFSEYDRACRALDIGAHHLVLSPDNDFDFTDTDLAELTARSQDADITIVCQPNNPTGALHDMPRVIAACRSRYLFIDNTYREFLHDTPHYAPNFQHAQANGNTPRIISLCSFTKYFHCTGIRLGYCVADARTIAGLRAKKAPWTVWRFAENLGVAFLNHLDEYRAARQGFDALRDTMARGLRATGLFARIFPAHANFLTAQLAAPESCPALARFLLDRSLVVRQCDTIAHMPPGCLRMQVRTKQENDRLLIAMNEFAATIQP